MKLVGYRPHDVAPGVEIWEAQTFEIPIRRVLERRLVSAQPREWLDDVDRNGRSRERTLPESRAAVGYRGEDGEERRFENGLVVSSSFSAMLEFLTTSYLPLADGQCERLYRRAQTDNLPREAFRREMEQLLIRSHAGWHVSRIRRHDASTGSPVALFASAEEVPGERLETSKGLGVFPVEDNLVLTREFVVSYRGIRVVRRAWAMVSRHRSEPVIAWNGTSILLVPKVALLPGGFLASVDRDGTSLADLPVPCIGAPELEVRFLLQVPTDAELSAAAEKAPTDPALRAAAFLFDSRSAIALPPVSSLIPIVADPTQIHYVLSRTTATGLYVPTAPPAPSPAGGKAGRVLLGALPRFFS